MSLDVALAILADMALFQETHPLDIFYSGSLTWLSEGSCLFCLMVWIYTAHGNNAILTVPEIEYLVEVES